MVFDNDYLLEQVILKASLPDGKYTNREILGVAYDQLLSVVMPFIVGKREEFYVRKSSLPIQKDVAYYPVDDRACDLVLREVKLLQNGRLIDLEYIDPEAITSTRSGTPRSFYMENNSIVLYPTPDSSSGELIQSFFQTPSYLTEVTSCAKVSSVAGSVITASVPADFTAQDTYDIVSKTNGHDIKLLDLVPTSITDSEISFGADLSSVSRGDYLCLSKTSPFAQVPDGVQPWLIMLTVTELLEAMESLNAATIARGKSQMLEQKLGETISIRVQGAPKRFRNRLT